MEPEDDLDKIVGTALDFLDDRIKHTLRSIPYCQQHTINQQKVKKYQKYLKSRQAKDDEFLCKLDRERCFNEMQSTHGFKYYYRVVKYL